MKTNLALIHAAAPAIQRDRLLRLADVEAATGMKKSTIYALARAGKFPKPITVTRRMSAWAESAVLQWIQDLIHGVKNEAKND